MHGFTRVARNKSVRFDDRNAAIRAKSCYLARDSGNGSRLVRFALNEAVRERKLFPKGSLILNASINRAINHFESHQHPTRHVKTRSTSHSIEAILSLVFELNGRCLLSSSRFNTFKLSRQSQSNI